MGYFQVHFLDNLECLFFMKLWWQKKIIFLQMHLHNFAKDKVISEYKNDKSWKNSIHKVPAPLFKKTCPCNILPPPFFDFSDSPPMRKVINIYLIFTPPHLKRDWGGCPNYARSLYGEAPYVGKAKTKFRYRFNNYKSKHRAFRKGNRKIPQKLFHNHYCMDGHLGIDDWDFTLFEQCETHKQLKERETFWQHRLKTFYPLGLNEKEEYLY